MNGEKVASSVPVKLGDTITLGGVPLIFLPQTVAEREEQEAKRRAERPAAIWPSFLWLTVFQVLACLQLIVAYGQEATAAIPLAFLGLTVLMWLYYAALRATRCVGFEMETIAFFLSTLSLSITASSAQSSLFKQFLAILLGLGLFLLWLGLLVGEVSRRRQAREALLPWGVLLAVSLALALPQLCVWTFQQAGEGGFLQGHLGWAMGAESYLFFYLQNLGLAGLLDLGGLFLRRGGAFLRLAPALAIWLLAELVVFQHNVYDTHKPLYPAYAFLR